MISAFAEGLVSPFLIPAHAIVLIALGLLIGQQPSRRSLSAYIAGLAGGSVAVAAAFASVYSSEAVYALAALAGLLVAAAVRLPAAIPIVVAAAIGFAIAFDSAPVVFSVRAAVAMQLGTFVAASVYVAAAAAIAGALTQTWQRIGMRIVGSWVAASAILALALRLSQ